ncbi:MAG: GNAT family N-acetyltransferase [Actinomycetota bacterium]
MIIEVSAEQTYDVRRETLRDGIGDAVVTHPDDLRSDSFHLLAQEEGVDIGVVSCAPGIVKDEGLNGWRLYQMGVIKRAQSQGVGRSLVEALIDRVRQRGGAIVWAMARDSAQGFYRSCGFEVIGDQYFGWNKLPHHTVIRYLR